MLDDTFHVYDTTLRDGAQQEGLTLSVADKLVIARQLDELGVGFIEGGWPGAIPKDTEFFRRAHTELDLKHAQLAAFGATRRPGVKAAHDPLVAALRESGAPVVTLVAKSHDRHVLLALRTTLEENLDNDRRHDHPPPRARPAGLPRRRALLRRLPVQPGLRARSGTHRGRSRRRPRRPVRHQRRHDAERTRRRGHAPCTKPPRSRLGIHCHDDTACGVANTLVAVDAGVTHVQGTANGYGERAGNANLFSVVAGLQLKKGRAVLAGDGIKEMSRIAHAISEVTNVAPDTHQPYVGLSAFAHKAGLHASAVKVDPMLYQHIDPALVGNDMRMLVSDMAGRASVELKGRELGYDLSDDKAAIGRVTDRVKDLEARGYTFEAADASFELLLRDELGQRHEYFAVESWRVIVERHPDGRMTSEATVRLTAKGERLVAVGEGNGPVNALDKALRAALEQIYPELATPRADRLQGADPGRHARHRRGDPGADRVRRRHRRHLEHGRRGREHHRRLLARPGRSRHLLPPPLRPRAQLTPSASDRGRYPPIGVRSGPTHSAPRPPRPRHSGGGGHLVQEAVHAADLAAASRTATSNPITIGSPPRPQVPAEPGLVVVRVDRAAEREHQVRELLLHGADEPVDLLPPVGVGERVGVAAVGRPQRVDEPAAAPRVRLVPGGDVTLDDLLHLISLRSNKRRPRSCPPQGSVAITSEVMPTPTRSR